MSYPTDIELEEIAAEREYRKDEYHAHIAAMPKIRIELWDGDYHDVYSVRIDMDEPSPGEVRKPDYVPVPVIKFGFAYSKQVPLADVQCIHALSMA